MHKRLRILGHRPIPCCSCNQCTAFTSLRSCLCAGPGDLLVLRPHERAHVQRRLPQRAPRFPPDPTYPLAQGERSSLFAAISLYSCSQNLSVVRLAQHVRTCRSSMMDCPATVFATAAEHSFTCVLYLRAAAGHRAGVLHHAQVPHQLDLRHLGVPDGHRRRPVDAHEAEDAHRDASRCACYGLRCGTILMKTPLMILLCTCCTLQASVTSSVSVTDLACISECESTPFVS